MLRPFDAFDVNTIIDHLPKRAHLTQSCHLLSNQIYSIVDFTICRKTTKPDS